MGTWKDGPGFPRPPPPPQLGNHHVVPGVGGGRRSETFWVLRIASSSFSLSRQLRRRRALPRSLSKRSGDPQPGAPARAMREPLAAPAAPLGGGGRLGGSSASPRSLGSDSRCAAAGAASARSPPLRRLPAPGPAAPGGCGSSASLQLFADCSCLKVRQRGQQPIQTRAPHLPTGPFAPGLPELSRGCPAGVWRRLVSRGAR